MDFDIKKIVGLLISLLEEQEEVKIEWEFAEAAEPPEAVSRPHNISGRFENHTCIMKKRTTQASWNQGKGEEDQDENAW